MPMTRISGVKRKQHDTKMKKMMKLISVVAVLLTVACTKSEETVNPTLTQHIRFTAEAPMADNAARAGYDATVGAHWDADDVVYVYLNSDNKHVEFTQQEGSLTTDKRTVEYGATLSVAAIDETITALYLPAQVRSGNAARITLPAEQQYVENGYTQIPLVGKATGAISDGKVTIGNMTFKNYFAILKFNLKGDLTVKKMVLSDADGAVVAGKGIVYPNKTNDDEVVNKWDGATDTNITLNCGTGVALDNEQATAFYVVVPSKNLHDNTIFANGCKIDIYTADGVISKKSKGMGELAENTIYDTPTLTLTAAEAKKIVPDATFRNWLADNNYVTIVDATTGEVTIAATYSTTMSVKASAVSGIVTFQGVEYFSALTKLELVGYSATCTDTTFDLSKMSELKNLIVNGNNLKSLDLSHNLKLTQIYCYSNEMTELDVTMLTATALNVRAGKQSNDNENKMVVYARADQTNSSAANDSNKDLTWTVVE